MLAGIENQGPMLIESSAIAQWFSPINIFINIFICAEKSTCTNF